jgi:internalin A
LAGPTNLASLWLQGASVSNLALLPGLGRLGYLMLDDNAMADPPPSVLPASLLRLSLQRNRITNCAAISLLTNLLDLGLGGNFISDVSELANLGGLASLNLYSNRVSDLSPLIVLTNLRVLNLGANPASNYAPLSEMSNLTRLSLQADSITSLAFLQNLAQLTNLDLHANPVSDFSPLGVLSNLTSMDLGSNLVANWDFLSGLPNLSELRLAGDSLASLDFIKLSPRISTLDVTQNLLADLSGLSGLTNLHCVKAGFNRLTDISTLQCQPRLWDLDLRTNLLDTTPGSPPMAVVQCLTNRAVAVLYDPQNQPPSIAFSNLITVSASPYWPIPTTGASLLAFSVSDDVTPAGQLVVTVSSSNPGVIPDAGLLLGGTNSARTLRVTPAASGTASLEFTVTDGTGLTTNTSVLVTVLVPQVITFPDRNLRSAVRSALGLLGNITNFALLNLTQLDADASSIGSLSGLQWATNLAVLSLNGNALTSLAALQNLTRLTSLSLNNNATPDLSLLAGLTNLTYLDLAWNPATNYASVLPGLTNLTTLFLDGDALTNLAFVQNLKGLVLLSLSDNRITDLSPLAGLGNIVTLYLEHNLVTNINVFTNLPNLLRVDISLNLLDLSAQSSPSMVIQALVTRGAYVNYSPQRQPPVISAPAYWALTSNSTASVSIGVGDIVASPAQLAVAASSSDPSFIPAANFFVLDPNSGGTGWILTLVAPAGKSSDTITLTATNDAGLGTNATILVTVSGQVFANTNLVWSTWGDALWFNQTNVTHSAAAAQSGSVGNAQASWLEATVAGPGRLTFWWRVSSETNYDWLEFLVNGSLRNRISGEVGWQQHILYMSAGTQKLDWAYMKDPADTRGLDSGWLGDVTFEPGTWIELAGAPATNQCQLILHGVPGRLYTVMVATNLTGSSNPTNWSGLDPSLIISNSATPFVDTNASPGSRLYRLRDSSASLKILARPADGPAVLVIHNPAGVKLVIQTSSDLASWSPLATLTNSPPVLTNTDTLAVNFPRRFYRAVLYP